MVRVDLKRITVVVFFLCAFLVACSSYRAEKHFKRGVASRQGGDTTRAVDEFTRALEYDSSHAGARFALAAIYQSQELWDEAISQYREIIRADPEAGEAEYSLGVIYSRLGELDRAVECFNRVLSSDPDNAEAHYSLGCIYRRLGEEDEAIAAFKRAVSCDDDFAEAHYLLSLIYFVEGDFDRAREHAAKANREYPRAERLLSLIEEVNRG